MAIKVSNGLDLANQQIVNLGTPGTGTAAANRDYVDAVARGLDWKASVRAGSTGNIVLTGPGTVIDGVTMAANDRFLAKDQTAGAENGIYVWNGSAVAATRAVDADSSAEVTSGMAVTVTEGTINNDRVYVLTTNDPITLGTTALAFAQLGGAGGSYVAGNGLTESPAGTFNVGAGSGITVTADAVAIDTAVVARKYAVSIGDGAATVITVTHNLGTFDVGVELFLNAGVKATELVEVDRPSVNTIRATFATAPATGAYRVVVWG
ncbi:MAG: head decoration protein [Actinomycetota bacterium]|nr:head decoration protein [Actinomycetota bacterium]